MGHKREANQYAVIGAILISPECLLAARKHCSVEDFSELICRAAFDAACQLSDGNEVVDPLTIASKVSASTGRPDSADILAECMQLTPTARNVEAYARLVREDARAERIRKVAEDVSGALDSGSSLRDVIANLQQQITEEMTETDAPTNSEVAIDEWLQYFNLVHSNPDAAYCATGFKPLDDVLGGGMFRSGLYIIGARPGMGKTTLAINVAENIVKRGKRILFVSLEMSSRQITAKRIAWMAGCNYTGLLNGNLSDGKIQDAMTAAQVLFKEPFELSDRSGLKVSDISALAIQFADLECIIVDYLGLLSPEDPEKYASRYEAVTEISKNLKALAKRLDIPILALAQLNRANTEKKDKEPQLQDLRDSGAIEQDADAVIMLHRPNYYDGTKEATEDIKLLVEKNRHGSTDCVSLAWNGSTGQITCPAYRPTSWDNEN